MGQFNAVVNIPDRELHIPDEIQVLGRFNRRIFFLDSEYGGGLLKEEAYIFRSIGIFIGMNYVFVKLCACVS